MTTVILLAAGQVTRMQSDLPKVLHAIGGAPLLHHAMRSGAGAGAARTIVVTGHGGDAVAQAALDLDEGAEITEQADQLGTAHAVVQAIPLLKGENGPAIVLYGDTPFVRPETLQALIDSPADVTVLGFEATDPAGYGRLLIGEQGLERIVEHKDATEAEREITLCNSGVVCAKAPLLTALVAEVGNDNLKGEYYLTDIVGLARARGLSCATVTCDESETLGINSRAELAEAEAIFQARARAELLDSGVTMIAPETVFLAFDTVIGRDVTIAPFVTFGPGVTVETGAEIRSFCHLEGCHISQGAQIGPYARLRPGAEIAEDVRVGNFVEVKNADVQRGAKINHLSYVGDADVGEGANIGAGTITCNYDGVFKYRTRIGAGAFIGSNTALVAPVTVEAGGYVASGSVVTRDVPSGDLAIARARQENKTGLGARMVARLKALKAKGTG